MDTCTSGNFIGSLASGLVIESCGAADVCFGEFPNDFMTVLPVLGVGDGPVLPCRQ